MTAPTATYQPQPLERESTMTTETNTSEVENDTSLLTDDECATVTRVVGLSLLVHGATEKHNQGDTNDARQDLRKVVDSLKAGGEELYGDRQAHLLPEVIPYFMTHDEFKRFWPKVEGELTEFYRDSNGDWNKRVYDAPTRTLTETYSTGTTNVTKFNEAGLPIDVRSSTGEWIESTYNKDGYLLTERNSHGQIVNKTYDEHNNELTSSISYFDVDEEEGLTP
jgi:hypothetical protein